MPGTLRALADILAELDECISKAVRVEVRRAGADESFTKYRAAG
jgi:hypothetical protein